MADFENFETVRGRQPWGFAVLLYALALPLAFLGIPSSAAANFDYAFDRVEIDGGTSGPFDGVADFVDDFSGSTNWNLDPFGGSSAQVVGGLIHLTGPGLPVGLWNGVVGSRSDALSTFVVGDGAGSFTVTTVLMAQPLAVNDIAAFAIHGCDELIGAVISNLDAPTAAAFGVPSGYALDEVYLTNGCPPGPTSTHEATGISIDPGSITGDIFLRFTFDDPTNTVTTAFSVDGGVSFQSPFPAHPYFNPGFGTSHSVYLYAAPLTMPTDTPTPTPATPTPTPPPTSTPVRVDYAFDRVEIDGGAFGPFDAVPDLVDDFNSSGNWNLNVSNGSSAQVVGGHLQLTTPGAAAPLWDGVVAYQSDAQSTFAMTNGSGSFSLTAVLNTQTLAENDAISFSLFGCDELIGALITNLDAPTAAVMGVSSGYALNEVYLTDGCPVVPGSTHETPGIAIDSASITGDIFMRVTFDDTADTVTTSFSIDGGASFQSLPPHPYFTPGFSTSHGLYLWAAALTAPTPTCGNGLVEFGEACDQGAENGTPDSCCSGTCQLLPDGDGDGFCDSMDNCPATVNPDQLDSDGQGGGDVCDVCPVDATDTCNVSQTAASSITSAGGTLATPDGSASVDVPAGAVAAPVSVSITGGLPGSAYAVGDTSQPVFIANLGPSGYTFDSPVTVTITWPDTDNDGVVDGSSPPLQEADLQLWKDGVALTGTCDDPAFQAPGCTTACCAPNLNTWTVQVTSFSEFLLGAQICSLQPLSGCRMPTASRKASLRLSNTSPDTADRVIWKWRKGEQTASNDFGNPTVTDGYALCVYAGATPSLIFAAVRRPGRVCQASPCWTAKGADGFKLKDVSGSDDGVTGITLKAGVDGKAKVLVKGKGTGLSSRPPGLPDPPLALPLRVQLQSGTAQCWEATYSAVGVSKNAAGQFRGKSD